MNLSESIQIYFQNSGSKIQLEKTDEGELPKWFARFNSEKERGFQIETIYEEEEFIELYSVDLKEKNTCFVRAAIINLEDAKELIYNWIKKKIEVDEIEEKYFALEKFVPVNKGQNKYWKEWNHVKSYVFNYTTYYNKKDKIGLKKYNGMIDEIIVHPFFSQLKPDISINGLTLNSEDRTFPKYFISRGETKINIYEPHSCYFKEGMMYTENYFSKEFTSLKDALTFYKNLLIKGKNKN